MQDRGGLVPGPGEPPVHRARGTTFEGGVTAEAGGNAGPSVTMEAAAPTALHALLPAGPHGGTWWAEQRIRKALGAPGFAPVGRENGRKLWAMTERRDGPAPPKVMVRPYMPGMEGDAP